MVPSLSKMPSETMNRLVRSAVFATFLFDAQEDVFESLEVIIPAIERTRNIGWIWARTKDRPVCRNGR